MEQAPPSFAVRAQYVKDLSFESPGAPHSLAATTGERPAIDVGVDIKAQKIQPDLYESAIHIQAKGMLGDKPLFLADVTYAGVFELKNIPEDRIEAILMIDCPFVLFPFARRVISDLTRDGGLPPLMLEPIDFQTLYVQNRGRAQTGHGESATPVPSSS